MRFKLCFFKILRTALWKPFQRFEALSPFGWEGEPTTLRNHPEAGCRPSNDIRFNFSCNNGRIGCLSSFECKGLLQAMREKSQTVRETVATLTSQRSAISFCFMGVPTLWSDRRRIFALLRNEMESIFSFNSYELFCVLPLLSWLCIFDSLLLPLLIYIIRL